MSKKTGGNSVFLKPSEEKTLATRGYKLLNKLGEGSYASVYLAELVSTDDKDKDKPRTLACKILDVSKAPKDFVKKFLPRELDILVRISHPHVIHIHSIFQRKSKYFIFMRNAENGDLLEYVLKKGPISEAQGRVWLRQLALAVQYLHNMDIAHRDLKCENALITNNFNLKLADFGFARFVTDARGRRVTSSTYCGSLSYAAPEILRGMPYHPKIADVWSLGVILYIMINKAMPFDDTNVKQLHEQQMSKRWKFRSKVVDVLSEQVKMLTCNLLEPDVTKRWRVEQIVKSEWLAMDPRLKDLNEAEEMALAQAQIERKNYLDNLTKKQSDKKLPLEDVKVLKANVESVKNPKFASTATIIDADYKSTMGHGFGQLYKLRGIITYRLSPFEQKAFAGMITHGVPNTIRRIAENFLYVVPPLTIGYIVYDQAEKEHHRLMLKNPADYENDK